MSGPLPAVETIRFPVKGMTCGSCVARITRALRRVQGVTSVRVDLVQETATVRREPASVSDAALAAAVEAAGYVALMDEAVAILSPDETAPRGILDRLLGRSRA